MYAQAFSMLVDGNKRNTTQPARPLPPPTPPPRPPLPPIAVGSHETCTFPDCVFVGTKKAVSAHYTSTHGMYSGSGIKSIVVEGKSFGVLLGDDPEEIKLWREQRRSRFPTTTNTQQKLDTTNNIQLHGGIVGHDNKTTKSKVNNTISSSSSSGTHTSTTKSTTAVCKTFVRIGKCKYGKRCRYIHDSTPTAGPLNTTDLTNTANSTTDNTANSTSDNATNSTTEQTSTTTEQSQNKAQKPPPKVRDAHKSNDTPTTSGRSEVKRQRISYHTNLLERLLDDEIVYEDNMILQCIRYLCVNKLCVNKTSS